jgi:hypothetical protein
MLIALLGVMVNWLSFWDISIIKHFDITEVELWFSLTVIQYFTCSLISIRPKEEGAVDMPAFYDRQRPVLFVAYIGMCFGSMIINYWDRNHTQGFSPTAWIGENAAVLVMLLASVAAGWAKPRWLQWAAGLVVAALMLIFLSRYTLPA